MKTRARAARWLVAPMAIGLLGATAGCRYGWAPTMRNNFPSNVDLEASCHEMPRDPDEVHDLMQSAYRKGWRIAYASESGIGFFIFTRAYVQLCFERPLNASPDLEREERAPTSRGPSQRSPAMPTAGSTSARAVPPTPGGDGGPVTMGVSSMPAGARVELDGRDVGVAPLMLKVAEGAHLLRGVWPDGRSTSVEQTAVAGKVATVRLFPK